MNLPAGSLFFRTALVLALAMIVFQSAAMWVVYRTVIAPVAEQSADDLAGLVVLSAQTWIELPPETRAPFERELLAQHGLALTARPVAATADAVRFSFRELIEAALRNRLDDDTVLFGVPGDPMVWVKVPVGERSLWVGFPPERYALKLPLATLAVVGLGTLLSLLTALFLVRRLAVPLAQAAAAARKVGAGEMPEPLPETGPSELVELAQRFNRMARAVSDLIDNRTTMLAGISHDLRTPMTRLRLTLELLRDSKDWPAPERIDRALADLDAMNDLITGYLALAREARAEAREPIDLPVLLERIAADTGAVWRGAESCTLTLSPLAVRQVVGNLIENARRYGGTRAPELRFKRQPGRVRIVVRDFGPGIPPEQLERVFRPFYRIEASRSKATGGSGLGLAIARQLAESQGGRLKLVNREDGLDAVLEFPHRIPGELSTF
jgi:two-component system, OmpR family, osmolarity sensor histidine kinase EnvZ